MKNALEIVPVSRMDEMLKHALVRPPVAIAWEEEVPLKSATPHVPVDDDAAGIIAH